MNVNFFPKFIIWGMQQCKSVFFLFVYFFSKCRNLRVSFKNAFCVFQCSFVHSYSAWKSTFRQVESIQTGNVPVSVLSLFHYAANYEEICIADEFFTKLVEHEWMLIQTVIKFLCTQEQCIRISSLWREGCDSIYIMIKA